MRTPAYPHRRLLGVGAACTLWIASCAPALGVAPQLVASWPTAGASLSTARHTLELTFNRDLDPSATWAAASADDGSTLATSTTLDPADSKRVTVRLLEPVPGSFDLHWHAVAADSQLASDGDQPFRLQNASPAPPRIDVSPPVADNNERLELVGKGFAPDSPLQLRIADNALPLAATRTDATGRFNVEARVPAAVPYGVQPISAADAEAHTAVGSVFLRYGGWPPVVGNDVGQAGPSPGEVTFTLTVRNLSDYVLEHVIVVMQDPDGGEFVQADPNAQRQDGSVSWLVPKLDRGSVGPFRATYLANRPVVSHAWLQFRHRRERNCQGDTCVPAFISDSVADSVPVGP